MMNVQTNHLPLLNLCVGILQFHRHPFLRYIFLLKLQKSRIVFRLHFPRVPLCLDKLSFRGEVLTLNVGEPLAQFRHLLLVSLDLFRQIEVIPSKLVVVGSQRLEGGFEI